MANAIIVRNYGTSQVLKLEEVVVGKPGQGELFIRQVAIGVHYHDVYVRTGLYKTLNLPGTPGVEAVGVIESIGPRVTAFKEGDRIVYLTSAYGAYASHRILDQKLAIKLPGFLSDAIIATNFSRALTVQMLINQVTKLTANHKILVTAASGGVGRLLCQLAHDRGALVIGSVSTTEKALLARSYGCQHSILYDHTDFVGKVMDITSGTGVDVVYDSVGADTFSASLQVLTPCGHLVNFGQSSGAVSPLLMSTLAQKSLTITRPIIFHYIQKCTVYKKMAASAFRSLGNKRLVVPEAQPFSLENASRAHDILESRNGGGSLYLIP